MNGDSAGVAHHAADVLDHGHVVEPGRHVPELVLGGGGRQLHDQLRDGGPAVTAAPLVIAASSPSMTYGGPCPPSRRRTRAS